jgi:hypothetical protein
MNDIKKKCIIITTINKYEDTFIDKYTSYDFDIIIVGDLKTPHNSYENKPLIYLHPEQSYNNIHMDLPFNHYCRKNIGYLYAINNNYDIIFDTDDDNCPLDIFNDWDNINKKHSELIIGPRYPNIYSLFTNLHIWPRGYPLELINKENKINTKKETDTHIENIGIYQSIANGDPDVDSIFRLTNQNYSLDITFHDNKAFILDKNVYTQANTQITFWICKDLFHLLYIPSTVSFRFCDILKMYIAQKCMWEYNKLLCYISPIVKQIRNNHNLMNDFISEYSMFINVFKIIDVIFENITLRGDIYDIIIIYKELLKNNIVEEKELLLLNQWLNIIKN